MYCSRLTPCKNECMRQRGRKKTEKILTTGIKVGKKVEGKKIPKLDKLNNFTTKDFEVFEKR